MNKIELIKNHIINSIKAGLISGGDRLPSCRIISNELSVNKITVNKAYKRLEEEHIVYCVPRGGFYVVDSPLKKDPKAEVIDFSTMSPDEYLIPHTQFLHAMNTAVDKYKRKMLGTSDASGLVSLRKLLKTTFEDQGIYSDIEQIVITSGAQQAIILAINMLMQKGGTLLAENPTYDLFLRYIEQKDINTVYIERTSKGYDFKQLENIFKHQNITAFYVIPRHHSPTGYNLTEKTKQRLVELAYKYNVILIEDDYMADLSANPKSLPLYYYDYNNLTIYIRSFSKSFMPGIRLGAAILPKSLVNRFVDMKYLTDLNTSTLSQASLEIFIKSGMYKKQVTKAKKLYSEKLNRARDIFSSYNSNNIKLHISSNGLFIWMQISDHVLLNRIEYKLNENKILFRRGGEFFGEYNTTNFYIRFCLSSVTIDDVRLLSSIIYDI